MFLATFNMAIVTTELSCLRLEKIHKKILPKIFLCKTSSSITRVFRAFVSAEKIGRVSRGLLYKYSENNKLLDGIDTEDI